MEYKSIEMVKSLLARIVAVALVISVLVGGIAHAEVPTCLQPPLGTRLLDSGIDKSTIAKIAIVDKEARGVAMGHANSDSGGQNNSLCCDNWCPFLFMTPSQSTAPGLKFRSFLRLLPQGSILTAYSKGLERPPKNLFTY